VAAVVVRIRKGIFMAFLDLREPMAFAVPDAGANARMPGFDSREWSVIRLASRDRLASLGAPGLLARLGAWLFGERINPRLADPRLETLRRTAVEAWHRGFALRESAMAAFAEAGFSADQLDLLLASVAATRPTSRRARA
jgi:hypothetical protein